MVNPALFLKAMRNMPSLLFSNAAIEYPPASTRTFEPLLGSKMMPYSLSWTCSSCQCPAARSWQGVAWWAISMLQLCQSWQTVDSGWSPHQARYGHSDQGPCFRQGKVRVAAGHSLRPRPLPMPQWLLIFENNTKSKIWKENILSCT